MRVINYIVVYDPVDVQARLAEGWQLWGSPQFRFGDYYFRQAMVMFERSLGKEIGPK